MILYNIQNLDSIITESKVVKHIAEEKREPFKIGGYNIPDTMDFTHWGEIVKNSAKEVEIVKRKAKNVKYHIQRFDKHNKVEIKVCNEVVLGFVDTMDHKTDLSTFTRVVEHKNEITNTYI